MSKFNFKNFYFYNVIKEMFTLIPNVSSLYIVGSSIVCGKDFINMPKLINLSIKNSRIADLDLIHKNTNLKHYEITKCYSKKKLEQNINNIPCKKYKVEK